MRKTIAVRVTEDTHRRLVKMAKTHGLPMGKMVEEMMTWTPPGETPEGAETLLQGVLYGTTTRTMIYDFLRR